MQKSSSKVPLIAFKLPKLLRVGQTVKRGADYSRRVKALKTHGQGVSCETSLQCDSCFYGPQP